MTNEEIAAELGQAARNLEPIRAFSARDEAFSIETAYDIQWLLVSARLGDGEQLAGVKIGLTSLAKQRQLGLDAPVYGWLTDRMLKRSPASIRLVEHIHPRVEPEIGFVLGTALDKPVTVDEVLALTSEVFCAFEGCRVRVDARDVTRADAPATAHTPTTAVAPGARVLIVDDSQVVRRITMRALANDGYVLTEAGNGREALELIRRDTPDLVILDLVMPELDGLDVLKALRASPTTASLPVLILTSETDESSTRAGFDVGATDYLTKPFSNPQLSARVRACLGRAAKP